MKKINTLLGILFLLVGIFIYVGKNIKIREDKELKLYSIPSYNEYLFNDTSSYEIIYYTNQLLDDNKEYYLVYDNKKLIITSYKENISSIYYNNETLYAVSIIFSLADPISFNDCNLEISSLRYNILLELGNLNIIEEKRDYLSYDYLTPHYSYINNNLYLVGLTISLEEDITLNNAIVNTNSFIQIQNIYIIRDLQDEMIYNYKFNIFDRSKGSVTLYNKDKYYLPLGYLKEGINGRINLKLNDKVVYLPRLDLSIMNLNDYPSFIRSGKIVRN